MSPMRATSSSEQVASCAPVSAERNLLTFRKDFEGPDCTFLTLKLSGWHCLWPLKGIHGPQPLDLNANGHSVGGIQYRHLAAS